MQAGKAFWLLMQAVPALFCTGQAAQKGWTTDPRSYTDEIETKGTEHITPDFPSHAVSYTVKSNVTKWVVWMFELGVRPLTAGKISWLLGSPSKGQRANKWQLKQDHFSYECLCEIPLITLTAFPLHTPQPCKQIKDSRSEAFPKPTVQSQTQTNRESWAFWYLCQSIIFTFGVFFVTTDTDMAIFSRILQVPPFMKLSVLHDTCSNFYKMEIHYFFSMSTSNTLWT